MWIASDFGKESLTGVTPSESGYVRLAAPWPGADPLLKFKVSEAER
jgi:hypothetical protein